ncbi:MAG: Dps family protein [Bacteroidota bacterium]
MNYLGLEDSKVESTVNELNQLLSNYHVYYQNLRNYHWNVNGENFFDLHEKFEALYNSAKARIDEVAERILTLRKTPVSKFSDYLRRAEIEEANIVHDEYEMVDTILQNHSLIIKNFRRVLKEADDASDEGTIDMIGGFLADVEKESWMLDAWRAKAARVVEA